jgi:hypothetical protein
MSNNLMNKLSHRGGWLTSQPYILHPSYNLASYISPTNLHPIPVLQPCFLQTLSPTAILVKVTSFYHNSVYPGSLIYRTTTGFTLDKVEHVQVKSFVGQNVVL